MSAPTRPRPVTTEEYVTELVNSAPAPSAEQIVTLRGLLGPALAEGEPVAVGARRAGRTAEGRAAA